MGAWTYGLGKGWLVGMKAAARAAARQPYRQEGWMVGAEVDCSGPGLGYHAGGPGGRTGIS